MLHLAKWNFCNMITSEFILTKIQADMETYSFTEPYDLVYFDAFSPKTQAELWTDKIFRRIHENMTVNGVLVTYSASGQVRRNLIYSGFQVEKIKGPQSKRHMLRAVKI